MRMDAKRILDIITWALVGAVVLLAVLLVGVRALGYTPYAVLSGSMEPVYPVGSLIYVKPGNEAGAGENITFLLNADLTVVTHRVVRVEGDYYYTQGDANQAEDPAPVHKNNVLGKPAFMLPGLGYVSQFLSTRKGLLLSGAALVFLMGMLLLPELMGTKNKPSRRRSEAGR